MENITTGHWIFAGIFYIFFFSLLIIAYKKDNAKYAKYYKGILGAITGMIIIICFIIIFNQLLEK